MAAIVLLTAAAAAAHVGVCGPGLTVWLDNGQLADAMVLLIAQSTAIRIFDQVDVKLKWRVGHPGHTLPCGDNLEIVLDEEAPDRFSPAALAYATVGARTTAIHVFYDRVIRFHTKKIAAVLLGHVFAHEITHVLENVARHSEEGLLKATWNAHDFAAMSCRLLPFDPIDAEMVRAHFGL